MKNFMDENFLLQTETAQKLYHEHAAKMPIIDYHCHLIPQMVADDYKFKSLTEIWLGGDHYKWRAMRTNGVDERYCTVTLSLQYDKGDLISTISPSLPYESSTGYGKLQTNYETGEDINYYRLPCMLVADTYPLSFHREALFAGMLGKPTQHLTTASYPEKTSDTYTERTEYTYSFDKNMKPVSLKVSTKYGNGKSISYLNRTISITIE